MSWGNTRAGSGRRGAAIILYDGLNSAYALSQVLFAALALLATSRGLIILDRWPGLIQGLPAGFCRLAICVLFLEYRQPRMTVALFAALLAAAALTY